MSRELAVSKAINVCRKVFLSLRTGKRRSGERVRETHTLKRFYRIKIVEVLVAESSRTM